MVNYNNTYELCPTFKSVSFTPRLISLEDADALLKVYSDEKAVPLFNSDNCDGAAERISALEAMGFTATHKKPRGIDGTEYSDYFVLYK